jgi:RNA polymerase sigma factor (sigma-70 family)
MYATQTATLPAAPWRESRPLRAARRHPIAELHAQCDALLRRFFARRGLRPDEVDDLTQDVYLRLARQQGSVGTAVENPKAFLFATATNLLRDRFRRRVVRGIELSVENDEALLEDYRGDPCHVVAAGQQLSAVIARLGTLKPATRRAFVRHRLLGCSHADVAREMGVSVSMVEKHMISAISALRDLR